ncbi:ELWxxDGT repeat protein [Neolewinella persica]|uniref:ELWxxDGT repeat protein n=1 Tax=Neolewinella persica TaxID=70998 RepID=UPI0003A0759F|nr:ELWxxDGT repeat protein [Neolewinella persica]
MRIFSLLLLLLPFTLFAQLNVTQVMDINTGTTGSRTSAPGAAFRGLLYFPATAADSGTELWVSDGTDAGTSLLTDLVPGTGSSNPADLIVVDDQLYFTAEAAATGRELYRTDGTAVGTVLVADIQPGTGSSIPNETSRAFVSYDGRLYFAAAANGNNVELWSAAGANAFLVREFQSGSQGSFPENFTVAGGLLYFAADNGTNGNELWQTNGNPAATFRLTDTNSGGSDGDPKGITEAGGKLFFLASNGFAAGDLYAYNLDGTGVQRVFDFAGRGTQLSTNTSRSPIARLGDQVVFAAENGNGADLWISDGTEAGTRVLLDNPEVSFGGYTPQEFVSVGDHVFYKDETEAEGIELWRTDGTTEGTIMVKDLDEGFSSSIFLPTFFHAHNGNLFFGAKGDVVDGFGSTGIEPYISNGTEEGTFLVKDINDGFSDADPNNFVSVGEQLFFFADNGDDGQELYVLSGSQPLIVEITTMTNVSCSGGTDGATSFTVSGGTPPYSFNDQSNDSGIFTVTDLASGAYNFIVTDALDSTIIISFSISQPNRLQLFADRINPQTADQGGSISLFPVGGTPRYSFSWGDTSLTSNIRGDLAAGTYFATLTDNNGCMVSDSFVVQDLSLISLESEQIFGPLCNGGNDGSLFLQVAGGSPPYLIDGESSPSGQVSLFGLGAGPITISVTDSRDSTANFTFEIPEPAALELVATTLTGQNSFEGGTIELMPTGGTPPYSISWADTSLTNTIRKNLDFGTYYLTLTDDNNCITQDSFIVDDLTAVTNLSEGEFKVYPTIVTGQLSIETSGNFGIRHITIYDLAGREINTMTATGQRNLTLSATFLPKVKGTYLVYLEATDGRRGIRRVVRQ